MFDLEAQDKPFDLVLQRDADSNATAGLYVQSPNAEDVQDVQNRLIAEGLRKSALRGAPIDLKNEDDAAQHVADSEARKTEVALAAVSGWYGIVRHGEPVAFSRDSLRELFNKRPSWRDRVLAALDNEANFTRG